MKKLLLLIVLCVLTMYCIGSSDSKHNFENIPDSDSTCWKEIRKAKNDSANGRLKYCRYAGSMLYVFFRSEKEFVNLLKRYNIGYKNVTLSDRLIHGQTQGCYMYYMNQSIEDRYGHGFIDSLKNVADIQFVKNHIKDRFSYRDCDVRPIYPGDTSALKEVAEDQFQKDFESIVYPSGYVKRPLGRDYWSTIANVTIHLLVDKHGRATILDYDFKFDAKKNHEFESHLEEEIVRILKKRNWTPAMIRNTKVNADCYKRLSLK